MPPALVRAHRRPVARLGEGEAARLSGASAAIDISDGLVADLRHLGRASGVGVALDDLPVADGATEEEALGGGEDYELLVATADPDALVGRLRCGRPPAPDRRRAVHRPPGGVHAGLGPAARGWLAPPVLSGVVPASRRSPCPLSADHSQKTHRWSGHHGGMDRSTAFETARLAIPDRTGGTRGHR